nr:putative capsid [Marmot picobirnavirus]
MKPEEEKVLAKDAVRTESSEGRPKGTVKPNRRQRRRQAKDVKQNTGSYGKSQRQQQAEYANSFGWYNVNPELIEGAARIPFGEIVGAPLIGTSIPSVPGVMAIEYAPTIGGQFNVKTQRFESTGVNQSGEARYSFVVHANSRNQSYSASDLTMVSLAGCQIFALISLGERIYGTMTSYSPTNYYLPKVLIEAQHFNFEDLQANYSHMWFDLNQRIARCNQIWIPKDFPIAQRWFWLNQAYYIDAQSSRGQIYLFTPYDYFTFTDTTRTGSGLTRQNSIAGQMTWSEYLEMLDSSITALLDSMDRGTMYGDILKAYGSENLYSLAPLDINFKAPIVYSPEVLMQIENASVFDHAASCMAPSHIEQTEQEVLVQNWVRYESDLNYSVVANYSSSGKQLLNFHGIASPSVENVTIATRLKAGPALYTEWYDANQTELSHGIIPSSCGTEIVRNAVIYYNNGKADAKYEKVGYDQLFSLTAKPGALDNISYDWRISMLSAFDWAPWLYVPGTVSNAESDTFDMYTPTAAGKNFNFNQQWRNLFGDWDNYAWIGMDDLARIHLACELSLFGLVGFGAKKSESNGRAK